MNNGWKSIKNWKPGIKELFLNSYYIERVALYKKLLPLVTKINGKVLDIGCGTKPYEHLFNCDEYIGLEIINSPCKEDADLLYDGKNLPFPDNHFDNVVSFQALCQFEDIPLMLKEIKRVIKPNGIFLLTTPFIWFDDCRNIEHRLSYKLTQKYLSESNFKLLKSDATCKNLSALLLLMIHYLNVEFISKIPFNILRKALKIILIAPFNLFALGCLNFLPQTNSICIDRISLTRVQKS